MKALVDAAIRQVEDELAKAQECFGAFSSAHEAIAVIREEYLELEQCVFQKDMHYLLPAEAVQLAAMAVRLLVDMQSW